MIDLTGQRFFKLLVISRSINGRFGNTRWNCLCNCGKNTIVDSHNLRRGNTRSCGCLNLHGRLSDETLSSKHGLFAKYRITCAKSRNLSFTLSFEEFINIVQQNCYYCDIPPNKYCKDKRARKGFFYNGLDRVDNNKGYEIDNVVPCCKDCNIAKMSRTKDEFINWIKKCFDHLEKGA